MPEAPRLTIDLDRCWGCGTCTVACALSKGASPEGGCIHVVKVETEIGAAMPGSPQGRAFVPVLCQHCESPECVSTCPTGALYKVSRPSDSAGLVLLDSELCIACGACEPACPYGAISLDPATGRPAKCDLCADRLADGLLPSCVQHCPGRALEVRL